MAMTKSEFLTKHKGHTMTVEHIQGFSVLTTVTSDSEHYCFASKIKSLFCCGEAYHTQH